MATVIDLGELTAPPVKAGPRWRPAPYLPWRRAERIGLLAVVLLAVLAASSPTPPGPLRRSARIPMHGAAALMVVGTHAIIVDGQDAQARISSYALPDGRREWTSPIIGTPVGSHVAVTSSIVIATMPQQNVDGSVVEAFDVRTGSMLWERPAISTQIIPDGVLIYTKIYTIQRFAPGPGMTIALVDPATGREHWSIRIPSVCTAVTPDDESQIMAYGLVEFCKAVGELSVVDLRTGRQRAHRQVKVLPSTLPPNAAAAQARELAGVLYVGAATLVMVDAYPRVTVSAFRTSDLAPLWSGLPMNANDRVERCGFDVCLGGQEQPVVIDPLTGHVLREQPIRRPTRQPGTIIVVPDAPAFASIRAGLVPSGNEPVAEGRATPAPTHDNGSAWIAIESASSISLVERLPGVSADSCVAIAGYIACASGHSELTFWRMPS